MPTDIARPRARLNSLIWTTVTILLVLSPLIWMVLTSFKRTPDIFSGSLVFSPTLENYAGITTPDFLRSFLNSAMSSIGSTVLALVIGVPAAYVLARARKSGGWISIAILLSRMAPPIAFTIPYFLAYRYVGLLDTVVGLVIIYLTFNLSLVIWLMRGYFEGIPEVLEEAAQVDGASPMAAFLRVVLPISGPGLVTTAILCFLYSWNDFFFALILTRSNASTAPVEIVNFMNYEGWEWGRIAAASTLIMLPILVFSLLMRRFLVSGMTAGAVKG
jgi:multiple sugar transport system permease protein